MLKQSIPDVTFSAQDIGYAIAKADDRQQREVLLAWAQSVDDMNRLNGSWPMQCRAIVDGVTGGNGLTNDQRERIASFLGDLIDHLKETVADS